MPQSLICGSKGGGGTGASATIYGGMVNGTVINAGLPTTESQSQALFSTSGTLSFLSGYFSSYDRAAGTVKSRIGTFAGGANGAQSVSVSAAGAFQDSTHTDSITTGQYGGYQVITGSGGTASAVLTLGVLFQPSSSAITVSKWGQGYTSSSFSGAGGAQTFFQPIQSFQQNSTSPTEGQYQIKAKSVGTWRNLYYQITANTLSVAMVYKSRVGTADGAQSVSIATTVTGLSSDSTHTDSISVGNLLSCTFSCASASGSVTITNWGSEFETANATEQLITESGTSGGFTLNASTTGYRVWGDGSSSSTQASYQFPMLTQAILSNLQCQVTANNLTAGQTIVVKTAHDATLGAQSISFTAPTGGYAEDSTHTDSALATGSWGSQAVVGSGSNSTGNGISVLATTPSIHHRAISA